MEKRCDMPHDMLERARAMREGGVPDSEIGAELQVPGWVVTAALGAADKDDEWREGTLEECRKAYEDGDVDPSLGAQCSDLAREVGSLIGDAFGCVTSGHGSDRASSILSSAVVGACAAVSHAAGDACRAELAHAWTTAEAELRHCLLELGIARDALSGAIDAYHGSCAEPEGDGLGL